MERVAAKRRKHGVLAPGWLDFAALAMARREERIEWPRGGDWQLGDVQHDLAAASLRASLRVPSAAPVLAGHFPGAPLVPGVLLLDAARSAWELATSAPHTIAAIDDVRWHAPLAPAAPAALHATATTEGDATRLAGEWFAGATRVCTFVLRLRPAPPPHPVPPRS
jgi:3-hydroxyacyl-[acyl-carrier-protein] dehydratase